MEPKNNNIEKLMHERNMRTFTNNIRDNIQELSNKYHCHIKKVHAPDIRGDIYVEFNFHNSEFNHLSLDELNEKIVEINRNEWKNNKKIE